MHFIYYKNRSIATKVDSTKIIWAIDQQQIAYIRTCLNLATGGCKPVTLRSLSPPLNRMRHTCNDICLVFVFNLLLSCANRQKALQ